MHTHLSLPVEVLREFLDYAPETGIFVWKVARHGARWPVGRRAGYIARGYRKIKIHQTKLLASRLAWAMMTGAWPTALIDHINRDTSDDRWANLREATPAQNAMNSIGKRGPNRLKGASFITASGKWQASICVGGVQYNLGLYATEKEAHDVYVEHAIKNFKERARVTSQ